MKMTLIVKGYYEEEEVLRVTDDSVLMKQFITEYNRFVTDVDYQAREGDDVDVLTEVDIADLKSEWAEKEKKRIEAEKKKREKDKEIEIEQLKLLVQKYPEVLKSELV